MPWGLSDEQYTDLVEAYEEAFGDLLEYAVPSAEDAISSAAEAISDYGDDHYDVLSSLIDERAEAHAAFEAGMEVEWDISEYADYDLDDEWLYYH